MQTAPVALSELLRLAFPSGSEFIGTAEQRSRVVRWATVISLPLRDEAEVEEDDLALLPDTTGTTQKRLILESSPTTLKFRTIAHVLGGKETFGIWTFQRAR